MKKYSKILPQNRSPPALILIKYFFNNKIYIMKSLMLTAVICLFTISGFGQLSKNTWLLGGNGSLFKYNGEYIYTAYTTTDKFTNFEIAASAGYFLADKFVTGVRPYFYLYKGEVYQGGISNNSRTAIGPFARYYFLKEDKQFNLLLDGCYQFGISKINIGDKEQGKFNTFSLLTGIEVFFNSTVGLELLIGYKNQFYSIDNGPNPYSHKSSGLQTSIGFHFHLEKN